MALSCIIIEDQVPAQRILKRYVAEVPELELCETFTDPLAGLAFMRQQAVDLLFLDINLPKISGMDFLKILPYQPKVILTTAYSDYALQGYEHEVVDYLLKPISLERFLKAVSKVIRQGSDAPVLPTTATPALPDEPPYLFVKSDRNIIKLRLKELVYVKAEDDYTRVYTLDKPYFLSYSLKYWESTLPQRDFARIHKSHLVNLAFVERIEGNQVYLQGIEPSVPIGRSYRNDFLQRINLSE